MAVGIHNLKAAHGINATPLQLTTGGSASIAQTFEIENLEKHVPIFARAGAAGAWVSIPPRQKINVPIPAAADTDLYLGTNGEVHRRSVSVDTEKLAPEAPVRVRVSAGVIAQV